MLVKHAFREILRTQLKKKPAGKMTNVFLPLSRTLLKN